MCSPVVKFVRPGQWLSKQNTAITETHRIAHHGDLKGLLAPFVTENTLKPQVTCFPIVN